MKNSIFSLILSLTILVISGCKQDNTPTPLKFNAYEHNPILSPGQSGTWDDLFLWTPQIVLYEDVFYLYYLGGNKSGRMAVGFATSPDGFHFTKFAGNPVMTPDDTGFDAYTVGPGIIVRSDSAWLMYYNAQDLVTFAPGRYVGRATSATLNGPWLRSETPVISSGHSGEWDAGFIIPSAVLIMEDGSFMMFYTGGIDLGLWDDFYVGMATSQDGINWKKYNEPGTTQHPFEESDPVLMTGNNGEWDGAFVWMANVTQHHEGFRMYYTATGVNNRKAIKGIGYATSKDGIHWEKYTENPVYHSSQDPFAKSQGIYGYMENPSLVYLDTICLMFYDCGPIEIEASYIGMATATLKTTAGN